MTTMPTPPGWHPDPANPASGTLRYWDGTRWTEHTHAAPPGAGAVAAPAPGVGPHHPMAGAPQILEHHLLSPAKARGSFYQRNQYTFITILVSALYLVIDKYAHIVFIGILPLAMALRALQRKEPLFALAIVAAAVSLVLGITAFAHA